MRVIIGSSRQLCPEVIHGRLEQVQVDGGFSEQQPNPLFALATLLDCRALRSGWIRTCVEVAPLQLHRAKDRVCGAASMASQQNRSARRF
jgi:hypothetical protein